MHLTSTRFIEAIALLRRIASASWKPALFAVLLWAATAAGEVPVPGTPVPITLQTFVVMLAGLMLPWKQAGAAVAAYLAAGAMGLPVFAGGASTMALVGPTAGFLIGFLPGVIVTAMMRGQARTNTLASAAVTVARYLFAAVIGCVVVVYVFGIGVQSLFTGVDPLTIAIASMAFIAGDAVKATVAALFAAGIIRR